LGTQASCVPSLTVSLLCVSVCRLVPDVERLPVAVCDGNLLVATILADVGGIGLWPASRIQSTILNAGDVVVLLHEGVDEVTSVVSGTSVDAALNLNLAVIPHLGTDEGILAIAVEWRLDCAARCIGVDLEARSREWLAAGGNVLDVGI
jgi:hypothetical protein